MATSPEGAIAKHSLRARIGETDFYPAIAVVLVVLLVIQTLNRRWSSDYWIHQVTLDALRDNLWHPIHPLVGTHDKFEYYSPYMFVLAVIGRVTGASSVVVLQFAAIGNLILFLVGFRLFVRELTNRLAVAWALVATLVFWGLQPWRWSGVLDLNSIGFGLPYPSMFATGLAFIVGWSLLRYGATSNRWWLVAVGVGLPTVMLTHPLTGVWASVMLAALVIHRRLWRRDLLVPLAVTLVAVVALLAIWPYYPFFRLFEPGNPHAEGTVLYNRLPIRLFSTLPGFVVLWRRFKRDRTDELVLMFFGAALLYILGIFMPDHNLLRVIPLLVLPLHIGVGELIASALQPSERPAPAMIAWLAVCGVVGLVGVSPAVVGFVPRSLLPGSLSDRTSLQPLTSRYPEIRDALPAGSEVVVQTQVMQYLVPAKGMRVLSTSAAVFVPDSEARRRATQAILSPNTDPALRARLIRQYDVAGVFCSLPSCRKLFTGTQTPVEGWTLIRLDAPN